MAWADIMDWDPVQKDWFPLQHWMGWRMPNSNDLVNVTLSGTVELSDRKEEPKNPFMGAPGTAWHRDRVNIYVSTTNAWRGPQSLINLPDPAPGMEWRASLEQWVVDGSLASIGNEGPANYAGWAIEEFGAVLDTPSDVYKHVLLWYDLSCRDVDGWIARLNYYVNFIARLSQYRPEI